MSLQEEYQKDIREIESSLEELLSRKQASRAKAILDHLLPFALLSLTFIILFAFAVPVNAQISAVITYLNWAVVLYFAARLVVEFRLSNAREKFIQQHWMDFLMIIPAFSLLQEVKLVQAAAEAEAVEEDAMIGSVAASRNIGVAGRLTKTVRIVKRSVGL